jgi:rhomboid protease GluP
LGGNLFLFIPFFYYLIGHFNLYLFPLAGFLIGGLTNFFVLKTMAPEITLVGLSGDLYWMGATYITLSFFIDRRENLHKRFIKSSGVMLILFFPTVITPEVSYLSHAIGFLLGVISASLYYLINNQIILNVEIYDYSLEEDIDYEVEL